MAYKGVKLANVERGGVVLKSVGRFVKRIMFERGSTRQRRQQVVKVVIRGGGNAKSCGEPRGDEGGMGKRRRKRRKMLGLSSLFMRVESN